MPEKDLENDLEKIKKIGMLANLPLFYKYAVIKNVEDANSVVVFIESKVHHTSHYFVYSLYKPIAINAI